MKPNLAQLYSEILASIHRAQAQGSNSATASSRSDIRQDELMVPASQRDFGYWTGISLEDLPPKNLLTEKECEDLVAALVLLWQAYEIYPMLPDDLSSRERYAILRDHWSQSWDNSARD